MVNAIVVLVAVPVHPVPFNVQALTGQRVGFEFVKNDATAFPKSGDAFPAEKESLTTSGEVCFTRVFVQSGFCLKITLSYVIGPFAF